jgi:chemotaxis protein MotB
MPIKVHHPQASSTRPKNAWMLTFADLLSLILTFFVLMYAMSSLEEVRWKQITSSLSQRLNPNQVGKTVTPTEQLSITKIDVPQAKDLQYLYTIITEKFASNEVSAKILKARLMEDELILSLPADVAFNPGTDTLAPQAKDLVGFLGDVVGTIGNHIDVVGHADPNPIKEGGAFPSNWELSLSRAMVVADMLKYHGYMYKINVFGRASSTLENLSGEVPEAERYQYLRRVDIVIRHNRAEL